MVNKDVLIGQYLRENKTDFVLLTETWYTDDEQYKFECSELNQNGYKIRVANRQNRIGGGIAVLCKSNIDMVLLKRGCKRSFEFGIWKLVFKNITIHVIGVYRPLSLSTVSLSEIFATFLKQFSRHTPIFSYLVILIFTSMRTIAMSCWNFRNVLLPWV